MARSSSPTPIGEHGVVAWSAVTLAAVALVLAIVALSGHGFGGATALTSATALVLAVVARVRHDRWSLLWLPLLLFPVLLATAPWWV